MATTKNSSLRRGPTPPATPLERLIDNAFYFPVAKLGFRLTFKLRFPDFDADDGRQAFADVFTGQVVFIVL